MPRGIEQEVDVKTTGPSPIARRRPDVTSNGGRGTPAPVELSGEVKDVSTGMSATLRDERTQGCPALFMFYSRSWPYQSGLASQRYGLTRSPLRIGHIRPPVSAEAGGQQSHGHASPEMEQHQRRRTGMLLDSDARTPRRMR